MFIARERPEARDLGRSRWRIAKLQVIEAHVQHSGNGPACTALAAQAQSTINKRVVVNSTNPWQIDYFGTSASIIAVRCGKINQQIGWRVPGYEPQC